MSILRRFGGGDLGDDRNADTNHVGDTNRNADTNRVADTNHNADAHPTNAPMHSSAASAFPPDPATRALAASTWARNTQIPIPGGRLPTGAPRRRNRRGRGIRGMVVPPSLPAYRTRSERFDELVLETVERLERRWGKALDGAEFAVEEIPPSDPARWERGTPLGRCFAAQAGLPPRIVVYRRPIEGRAATQFELAHVVRDVVVEQVAHLLGRAPHEIDPGYSH